MKYRLINKVHQSARTTVEGMGHSGATAQYKVFNGTGY